MGQQSLARLDTRLRADCPWPLISLLFVALDLAARLSNFRRTCHPAAGRRLPAGANLYDHQRNLCNKGLALFLLNPRGWESHQEAP
jgi:hypothetical protein